jgi:hypothetical protein
LLFTGYNFKRAHAVLGFDEIMTRLDDWAELVRHAKALSALADGFVSASGGAYRRIHWFWAGIAPLCTNSGESGCYWRREVYFSHSLTYLSPIQQTPRHTTLAVLGEQSASGNSPSNICEQLFVQYDILKAS